MVGDDHRLHSLQWQMPQLALRRGEGEAHGPTLAVADPLSAEGAGAGGQGNGWQGNKILGVSFPCHPFPCQKSATTWYFARATTVAVRKET